MILLVYRRFLAAADVWTATLICLGIVLVFAFAEYTPIGNYNYIAPYSHEATHGLMLSICAIAMLSDWINDEENPLCHRRGILRRAGVSDQAGYFYGAGD